jgi:2-polyprenyl-6-methoxyphenol hydroxylase-like FAD-dependent oxidoreductase
VTEHYDAIIVGSGAGGGTLAHTLARSGKRILLGNIQMCGKSNAEATKGEEPKLSIGAVNPTLTAIANTIRVGEHLLSRMS